MVDVFKKYNKIIISLIAVLAIFAVLPFIVKKGTNSLTGVIPDTIIIPDTVDKIMTSIMLFIGSLVGIITSLILMRKKRMN